MFFKFPVLRSSFLAASLLFVLALFSASFVRVKAQNSERSSQAVDSLSAKVRVEVFEEVWKEINEKYYDPKFNGVDWNAIHERYRPLVGNLNSDAEFYDSLNQMIGELRDAHTRVYSPRRREERKSMQATSAGVLIYEVEGKPVIFDITAGSDAERAGVKIGMTVRTIDGQPFAKALAEARREVGTSSSERATKILSYLKTIAGEPNTPLKLGLVRADGTPLEVSLTRRTISAEPEFSARLLSSGYAYIRFNRFRSPVVKQVKDALEKYKDAPGLILDLRSNTGGDGKVGMTIAGYFFNDKVPIARIVTRTGKPPSVLFGLVSLPKEFQAGEKGGQLYSNPVVILVNEGTASTSELISGAMQEQGRAFVIGTQSCGCVLGVLNHKELKDGSELDISEIGFVTSKGRILESNGITPDKPISISLADLQSGRDVALEEAEKYFNKLKR